MIVSKSASSYLIIHVLHPIKNKKQKTKVKTKRLQRGPGGARVDCPIGHACRLNRPTKKLQDVREMMKVWDHRHRQSLK